MAIAKNVKLGKGVIIPQKGLVNLYGCSIGDSTKVGAFVEIQKNARIGRRCKISSHTFICEGVTIGDEVFVGHNVTFINDRYPKAALGGRLQNGSDWKVRKIRVRSGASIGSSATIMCDVTVGKNAMIGAGAVVVHDVPDYAIVCGNPARVTGDVRKRKVK